MPHRARTRAQQTPGRSVTATHTLAPRLGRLFPAGGRTANTGSIFGGISRDADGKVTGAKAMAFSYLLAQAAAILTCIILP